MDPSIWLQIETKARALIKDLLEPTIRRVSETVKQIDELALFQTTLNYKTEDLEILVNNVEKRLIVIDEFSKKMNEFEGYQQLMDSKNSREREELKSSIYAFSKKQIIFEEDFLVLQKQKESMREDLTIASTVILNNKLETEEQIEEVKKMVRDNFYSQQNRFDGVEQSVMKLQESLKSFTASLVQTDSVGKETARLGAENNKAVKGCEKRIKELSEKAGNDLEKVRNIGIVNTSDLSKMKAEVKKLNEKIRIDEGGVNLQISFTEPLYSLFKDLPTLKVLAEFDKERMGLINTSLYSEATKEAIARRKAKAQEIIDTPLPIKRHDSNSSSVKRKRKERVKNLKKQMAASIAKQTFKVQKEEHKSKLKRHPVLTSAVQQSIKSSNTETSPLVTPEKQKEISPLPSPEKTKESPFLLSPEKLKDLPTFLYTEKNVVSAPVQPGPVTHALNFSGLNPPQLTNRRPEAIEISIIERKPKKDSETSSPLVKERQLSVVLSEALSNLGSEESDSELDNFIDFTPMINSVKSQLELDIQSKYEELKSSVYSTSSTFTKNLVDFKNELMNTILTIKSKHENYSVNIDKKIDEIQICIQQAVYECNSASMSRKRDHNDYLNQFKHFSSSLEEISKQELAITEAIEGLNKSVEGLIEYCRIAFALQGQDEQDRDSIFLMGSKELKKGKIVSLDKRCLSCAGQSSSVISAFKIACLAYEPSAVFFQDRRYSRKELLNVQRNIMKSWNRTVSIDTSEDREVSKGVMTSRHWRPLSVPISNFSTLTSPHIRTPDTDNLPYLRKSLNN